VATTTDMSTQKERPALIARSIALMKPITWFAAMWAFLCGAVASGGLELSIADITRLLLGITMAGPILCGMSQVINDYFDREIDALNEPDRLIPAGLVTDGQIIGTISVLLLVGFSLALFLGEKVAMLTGIGIVLALVYSAPPLRAKRNGWVGNTLVAIAYEGLAWLAGHVAFGILTPESILIAALYSFGAHGIMSINDYKSIEGDTRVGINTIPVLYGPHRAAWIIVITMNVAQAGVILAMLVWGNWIAALVLVGIVMVQIPTQRTFLQDPLENYLKFSAIGVSFFVWGMLVAAFGLNAL